MTVVAESVPHLKLGAIRDFKNIMVSNVYWEDSRWNETSFTYKFPQNSILEFVSFDKFGKAHGPRRDILFVNECNNLEYDIVDQLITRTKKIVWLDWNPTHEFWFYTEMLNKRDDIDFITLTYKDCIDALDKTIIDEIESHRWNKNWWKVYGEGQLGDVEGRIYTGWRIIDDIPHEARLERYGLDFGYHPDPAVIMAIYYYNGGWIVDEVSYRLEMHNREIAQTFNTLPKALVIADCAEPKSIAEIQNYGVNITGSKKGPDSKKYGIKLIQDQPISITKNSVHAIKEYRNYLLKTDKNGKFIPGEAENGNDHCMDAMRYALETLGRLKQEEDYWTRIFSDELSPNKQYKFINKGK
jgi:phage terminase large subunit